MSHIISSDVSRLIINDIILSIRYNVNRGGVYIIANRPEKADIITKIMVHYMDIYIFNSALNNLKSLFTRIQLLLKSGIRNSLILLNASSYVKDDFEYLFRTVNINIRDIVDRGIHLLIWVSDEQLNKIQLQTDSLTESIIKLYRFRPQTKVQKKTIEKTEDISAVPKVEYTLPTTESDSLSLDKETKNEITDKTIVLMKNEYDNKKKYRFLSFEEFSNKVISIFNQVNLRLMIILRRCRYVILFVKQIITWLMTIISRYATKAKLLFAPKGKN